MNKFKIGDEIITVTDRPMIGKIYGITIVYSEPIYYCHMSKKLKWSFYEHEIRLSDNQLFNESFEEQLK